jgi:hypothetical protein
LEAGKRMTLLCRGKNFTISLAAFIWKIRNTLNKLVIWLRRVLKQNAESVNLYLLPCIRQTERHTKKKRAAQFLSKLYKTY